MRVVVKWLVKIFLDPSELTETVKGEGNVRIRYWTVVLVVWAFKLINNIETRGNR